MTELPDLSAFELLDAYRARTLSPVEVVDAVLTRIADWDRHTNAFWLVFAAESRAEALRSQARWRAGQPAGPIDGIPVSLKENIATAGCPVPLGTAASDLTPAAQDAPIAARIREAGGIILGKTTMPDYGMLSSGLSSFHRLARNPWNLALNPGGSSSGAGAAGAAGYGCLHVGTDIGGSIRLPAGWCGIAGLKPSFGRVPLSTPYYARVAGPMTRSTAEAALLMSVIAQPDTRDPTSLPAANIPWMQLNRDVKGLRLALALDAGAGTPAEPEVAAAIRDAAARFAAAGATVQEIGPLITREMLDGLDRFWRMRSYTDMARLPPERRAQVLPYIRAWVDRAAHLSAAELFYGFSQMAAMRDALLAATRGFDFLLSPTSPAPSYPAELPGPSNDPERPFEHIGFTVAANMSEQPAISVNCGYSADGRPIGLQITGQRFDDIGVLQMAHAFEQMRAPQRAWPRVG